MVVVMYLLLLYNVWSNDVYLGPDDVYTLRFETLRVSSILKKNNDHETKQ